MNLHEILFELAPDMMAIFELGFIPEEDEIHELSLELYAAYERKGGDISNRLYTIIPKDETNRSSANEFKLLTEEEIPRLWKAVSSIRRSAENAGCNSEKSDEILAAAASNLPDVFSKNSKFAQHRDNNCSV